MDSHDESRHCTSQRTDELGWEACLSLPGLMGKVPQYHSIQYSFLDEKGDKRTRIAHGFHARVVQHECDHLDGVLYPQKMENIEYLAYREEAIRHM